MLLLSLIDIFDILPRISLCVNCLIFFFVRSYSVFIAGSLQNREQSILRFIWRSSFSQQIFHNIFQSHCFFREVSLLHLWSLKKWTLGDIFRWRDLWRKQMRSGRGGSLKGGQGCRRMRSGSSRISRLPFMLDEPSWKKEKLYGYRIYPKYKKAQSKFAKSVNLFGFHI